MIRQVSSRLLVSATLSQIPPSSCNPSHIPSLIAGLTAELKRLPERVSSYVSGLPLFPHEDGSHIEVVSISHIESILRLLDAYLLGRWQPNERQDLNFGHSTHLQQYLVALFVAVDVLTREENDKSVPAGLSILLNNPRPVAC